MSAAVWARACTWIDATYGHLARDADDHDRELLDAFDEATGHGVGSTQTGDDNEAGEEAACDSAL